MSQKVTRPEKLLFYPIHKTTKFEKGILYTGLKLFTNLPNQLKFGKNIDQLKTKLKVF